MSLMQAACAGVGGSPPGSAFARVGWFDIRTRPWTEKFRAVMPLRASRSSVPNLLVFACCTVAQVRTRFKP